MGIIPPRKYVQRALLTHREGLTGEVFRVLSCQNRNTAPGYDGIPNQLLRFAARAISTSLAVLCNYSRACGMLSKEWKVGVIKPSRQGVCRDLSDKYGLISLPHNVWNMPEEILNRHLSAHLFGNV